MNLSIFYPVHWFICSLVDSSIFLQRIIYDNFTVVNMASAILITRTNTNELVN
ncbi:hypothetical protein SAMN05216464_116114 [Mucilaginibacter pineti]|uniref:Uncharacterized protein n=1 Tax=Mucilaginibacter pineti TaxID=1391627 RepID=A0A1G7KGY0_9SPHI|nr:hypothetical protein SAMN05216464_116114 [Mucilaginibacter pineti]